MQLSEFESTCRESCQGWLWFNFNTVHRLISHSHTHSLFPVQAKLATVFQRWPPSRQWASRSWPYCLEGWLSCCMAAALWTRTRFVMATSARSTVTIVLPTWKKVKQKATSMRTTFGKAALIATRLHAQRWTLAAEQLSCEAAQLRSLISSHFVCHTGIPPPGTVRMSCIEEKCWLQTCPDLAEMFSFCAVGVKKFVDIHERICRFELQSGWVVGLSDFQARVRLNWLQIIETHSPLHFLVQACNSGRLL